ncbi:MAG TPA: 2Fe-2S iron-sulfur cluster-binding protein [Anaerolineaceae bacterium]|nr:2Fe-2S iron-sulfur cluster-binding protein [Anaerolineaceae bacterium]
MVTVTIDGKALEIPEGTTVLRAAQSAGIDIPTLCDHPHLTPYGGCRLCLVEVEGYRTLQPSCTLPVSNNMVIKTSTKKVLDARKFVLTLIFSERNHFCPYCQVSGGDCELQNAAYHEGMTHWPLQPNWQPYPVDASHPYIILENNRCILCRRCVRACDELIGNFTLGFEERGARSILVADTGVPLGESSCISCGACVQVCPTGALIDRWSSYLGHEVKFDSTKTICVGCSVGCGIEVFTRDNNLVRIDGDWDKPINAGVLCEIGRFKPMAEKCDRVFTPMIRKNGSLKAATWQEALTAAAAGLKESKSKVAALISTRQPVEALAQFKQLFSEKLTAELVTSLEEGMSTNSLAASADELGKPFESKLDELKKSDAVLVLDDDLVNDHQVAGFFVKRNLPKGSNLVVVDANSNELSKLANKVLTPSSGSYDDVVVGLYAAAVKLGLIKAKKSVTADDLAKAAAKTGLQTDDFLDAAFLLASSSNPVIVYSDKTNSSVLREFAASINAKLVSLKGEANSLAASQLHLDKPFRSTDLKAVFIALGDGGITQKLVKEIEKIPFKVVQASYTSALTAGADVLLPSTNWLEQSGHYISADGYVQEAIQSIKPAEDVLSISETLHKLADILGIRLDDNWSKLVHDRVSPVQINK